MACDDEGRDRNDSLQAQTYSYHQELGRGKEVVYPWDLYPCWQFDLELVSKSLSKYISVALR